MKRIITTSPAETQKIAESFAKKFSGGVIALSGDLGAGKTTFVQGFAKGLRIKDKIISPTFVLVRQHQIPASRKTLYHVDLYRLENSKDLKNIGLLDLIKDRANITLIEWAEKAKKLLPKNTLWITFELKDNQTRIIRLKTID